MTNNELEKIFIHEVLPHNKIIYKVCHQFTNSREDLNDLYQEVMLQLWKSFPNFQNKSKTSTWIYKVALNTSLYFRRREKRYVTTINLIEECFTIKDTEFESTKAQLDLVKNLMSRLSDIEKAIIMLHLDDYTNDEISTIMGITKTNVSTRINRIKNKLKNERYKRL